MLSGTDIRYAILAMRSLGWISFRDEDIPAMVGAIVLELDGSKNMDAQSVGRNGESE